MKEKRVRLTDVSIADIVVSDKVILKSADGGGYSASATNNYGQELLRTGDGIAVYPTIEAARRAVHRHKQGVPVETEVLPSPSLRPPIGGGK